MTQIKTQNIGKIEGSILVFGGVYSNLQALQKMKTIAESLKIKPSNIICTGDIVAYCAEPEACVQTVKQWGVHSIAGNVEIQLREGRDDCACDFETDSTCDLLSKQWYSYAQKALSTNSIEWMHTLPEFIKFDFCGKKCIVVHGSYFNTSEFIFRSTDWPVKQKNFEATNTDIILAGHCGLPFSHKQGIKYWLNPGVIGMPANDGTPRVWYMLLYPTSSPKTNKDNFVFEHRSFEYDNQKSADLMRQKELPKQYSQTLITGLWDNNDILPNEETALQGKAIVL